MKKIISIVLNILITASIFAIPVNAAESVDVYVNGTLLETDQPAIIASGRTMVPLRAVGEALDCKVSWDQETQTAQIQNQITIVSVQINNYQLTKVDIENQDNKTTVEIDVPPILRYGRTMVPIRAIAEAFNANVEWDGVNRCVNINLEYASVGDYNEYGLAKVEKNGKFGFINEKREEIIPVIYDNISYYIKEIESYIVVKDNKKAFMDKKGNIRFNKWYEDIESNPDMFKGYRGLIATKVDGKWGLISSTDHKTVVPYQYDEIGTQMDGIIRIWMRKGEYWGAFNTRGEIVEPFIYEEIGSVYWLGWYENNRICCKREGKWGEIDSYRNITKEFIYPYEVKPHSEIAEGIYAVSNGKKNGLMRSDGSMIVELIYDEMNVEKRSNKGYDIICCIVKQNGKAGVISHENGKILVPIEYDDVVYEGAVVVTKNGARGAYSHRGELLVDCIYDGSIAYGSSPDNGSKLTLYKSNFDYVDIICKDGQYTVNEVNR